MTQTSAYLYFIKSSSSFDLFSVSVVVGKIFNFRWQQRDKDDFAPSRTDWSSDRPADHSCSFTRAFVLQFVFLLFYDWYVTWMLYVSECSVCYSNLVLYPAWTPAWTSQPTGHCITVTFVIYVVIIFALTCSAFLKRNVYVSAWLATFACGTEIYVADRVSQQLMYTGEQIYVSEHVRQVKEKHRNIEMFVSMLMFLSVSLSVIVCRHYTLHYT